MRFCNLVFLFVFFDCNTKLHFDGIIRLEATGRQLEIFHMMQRRFQVCPQKANFVIKDITLPETITYPSVGSHGKSSKFKSALIGRGYVSFEEGKIRELILRCNRTLNLLKWFLFFPSKNKIMMKNISSEKFIQRLIFSRNIKKWSFERGRFASLSFHPPAKKSQSNGMTDFNDTPEVDVVSFTVALSCANMPWDVVLHYWLPWKGARRLQNW